MNSDKLRETLDFVKEFIKSAFSAEYNSSKIMRVEAYEKMDNFLILCFGELLGMPLPSSYYSIELLPYIAEDLTTWENRMLNRKEVLAERFGKYDWHD